LASANEVAHSTTSGTKWKQRLRLHITSKRAVDVDVDVDILHVYT
jgi:hypothetical protein